MNVELSMYIQLCICQVCHVQDKSGYIVANTQHSHTTPTTTSHYSFMCSISYQTVQSSVYEKWIMNNEYPWRWMIRLWWQETGKTLTVSWSVISGVHPHHGEERKWSNRSRLVHQHHPTTSDHFMWVSQSLQSVKDQRWLSMCSTHL